MYLGPPFRWLDNPTSRLSNRTTRKPWSTNFVAKLDLEIDALAAQAVDQKQDRILLRAESFVVDRYRSVRCRRHGPSISTNSPTWLAGPLTDGSFDQRQVRERSAGGIHGVADRVEADSSTCASGSADIMFRADFLPEATPGRTGRTGSPPRPTPRFGAFFD